jgi:hypothetical protein
LTAAAETGADVLHPSAATTPPPINARRSDGADTDEWVDADHFSMRECDARATALIVEKWLAEQIPAGFSGPSHARPHV